MRDLPQVNAVGENAVQVHFADRLPRSAFPLRRRPGFCGVPFGIEFLRELGGGAVANEAGKDITYQCRLPLVDDQLAVLHVIGEKASYLSL